MAGRRDFLKAFGLSSVVLPTVTLAGTQADVITYETVKPIPSRVDHMYEPSYMFDIVTAQLYSARSLDKDAWVARLEFFNYHIDQEHSITDTNLGRAGQLYAPEMFAIEKIGVLFSPGADPVERSRFIDTFTLEFWIGQKVYWRSPLAALFAVGQAHSTSQRNAEFPINGMIDMGTIPLVLDREITFHAELTGGSFYASSPLKMWTVLHGKHARGVQ